MTRKTILLFFFIVLSFQIFADVQINSTHPAPVTAIEQTTKEDALLLAGNNIGILYGIDLDKKTILFSDQVSHLPIVKIVDHPEYKQCVIYLSDSISVHKLVGYDYRDHQVLFTKSLDSRPYNIGYSPKGSYVYYTKPEWQSFSAIHSTSGRTLPILTNGFGIITFIKISGSENTIVSYLPASGKITYWEARTGKEKAVFETARNIQHLSSINDRYSVGYLNETLSVIDLTNGRIVSSVPSGNIDEIVVKNQKIFAVEKTISAKNFVIYRFFEGALKGEGSARSSNISRSTSTAISGDNIIFGTEEGDVGKYSITTRTVESVANSLIAPVYDMTFSENSVFVSTDNTIHAFVSDKHTSLQYRTFGAPYTGINGLRSIDSSTLLLWKKGGETGGFSFLNSKDGEIIDQNNRFEFPIKDIQISGDSLFLLEENGSLKKYNKLSLNQEYRYSNIGIQSFRIVPDVGIFACTNSSGNFETPLLKIDPTTGETVPVRNNSHILFDIVYDEQRNLLYSLGLYRSGSDFQTRIQSMRVYNPSRATNITTFSGEDYNGSILADPDSSRLYTSIGFRDVMMIYGSTKRKLDATSSIPGKLYSDEDHIYSVNTDSTITVWEKSTRDHVYTIIIFKNGDWLIEDVKKRDFIIPEDVIITDIVSSSNRGYSVLSVKTHQES